MEANVSYKRETEALTNRIPRAVYTKELRDEAVKLALTEGVGISEASRRLSIPIKTLANWVRAAKAGKLKDVGQHQKPLTEMEPSWRRSSANWPRSKWSAIP